MMDRSVRYGAVGVVKAMESTGGSEAEVALSTAG
jgi:hypothetical protein